MRYCVYCKRNNIITEKGLPLYPFPNDESILKMWLKNMRFDLNWKPSLHFLCAKHFTRNCFIDNILIYEKVPTIFEKDIIGQSNGTTVNVTHNSAVIKTSNKLNDKNDETIAIDNYINIIKEENTFDEEVDIEIKSELVALRDENGTLQLKEVPVNYNNSNIVKKIEENSVVRKDIKNKTIIDELVEKFVTSKEAKNYGNSNETIENNHITVNNEKALSNNDKEVDKSKKSDKELVTTDSLTDDEVIFIDETVHIEVNKRNDTKNNDECLKNLTTDKTNKKSYRERKGKKRKSKSSKNRKTEVPNDDSQDVNIKSNDFNISIEESIKRYKHAFKGYRFSASEYCDMLLMYGECHGVSTAASKAYYERYRDTRQCPTPNVFEPLLDRLRNNKPPVPTISSEYSKTPIKVSVENRVLKYLERNPDTSLRKLGRLFGMSAMTVKKMLKGYFAR